MPYKVRCTDRLRDGLAWAPRPVALLHDEIAPDPPGWTTSLRFDVDCPCDGRPHVARGRCDRAATYWRDVALPQPSFVVVNPRNGHAHYIYTLRGWIRNDGAAAADMPAVRYFAAIARAYTLALRADPGYAGLVHHNPLSAQYHTIVGTQADYSLRELAGYVKLAATPRRREPEIRCEGRNVETFDRLRFWAYRAVSEWRCGSYADWAAVVAERGVAIADDVRGGYATAAHAFTQKEALGIAKSVAGWVWLRYDAANPVVAAARAALRRARDRQRAMSVRRALGSVARDEYLASARRRRDAAIRLHDLGVSIAEIAHRLSAGVRSVYRWLSEVRCLPSPSPLSDFNVRVPVDSAEKTKVLFVDMHIPEVSGAHGDTVGLPVGVTVSPCAPSARSAVPWRSPCDQSRRTSRRRKRRLAF